MQKNELYTKIEDNEIDIKELFSEIWKNKYIIAIFSLIITSAIVLYTLKMPNIYTSSTVLIPKDNSKSNLGGGAAAMAALAGINLNTGGGNIDITGLFENLLNNYAFNKNIINQHNLVEVLKTENIEKNFVFASDKREVYDFFKSSTNISKNQQDKESLVFKTYKKLKLILSVQKNKKTGSIILSAKFTDRFATKKLIEVYLQEMSNYIKELDLKEIDDQVKYYERELYQAENLDLKSNINELLSALVKKKVLSQAGEFYMVKQLTKPQVAYIKDKVGPKRAMIIIVAFITSIIFGIFIIFFKNFLKDNKEKDSDLSF